MLWELLTLIGAITFIWAAAQSARQAHAGIAGYAAVIFVGVFLAAGYEFAAHKLAHAVDGRLKTRSASHEKWLLRAVYAFSAVFPFIAAVIGISVSESLLRRI